MPGPCILGSANSMSMKIEDHLQSSESHKFSQQHTMCMCQGVTLLQFRSGKQIFIN